MCSDSVFSFRSSCQGLSSESPTPGSPPIHQPPPSPPSVSFSLLATTLLEGSNVKLAIAVESATDLPSRSVGAQTSFYKKSNVSFEFTLKN